MSFNGPTTDVATTTSTSAWLNNLIAGSLSIFLNIIASVILLWSKNVPGLLKVVIAILKLLEICFSALFIVACPIFAAIDVNDFSALLIVNVGIETSPALSMAFLMNSLILLTQQIFNSPITYFIRYLQVCRRGVHLPHVFMIVTVNIVFLMFSAGLLCYASSPTEEDFIALSGTATSYAGHVTSFLVLSYDKDVHISSSLISSITFIVMLIFSVIIMVFCYLKINSRIASSPNMSENLMKMQKTANLILGTQFVLTLIFIQLPFFYSVLGPVVGLSQSLATYLLSILFVWGPVANAASLFMFRTEVRRVVFRCAKDRELNAIGGSVINVGGSVIKSDVRS